MQGDAHDLRRWLVGIAGLVLVLAAARSGLGAGDPAAELDGRIATLIKQLGADEFAVRERAQAELQRLGLAAFDALDQARHNDDVEIVMRARHLLRIMSVDWSNESDSPEVKGALRGYGDQPEAERRSRMERLSALDGGRGIAALCRLARFETNQVLSKRAALYVMQQPLPAAPAERSALAAVLRTTADSSKRTASAWLRLYAQTIDDPQATVDGWQKVAVAELQAAQGAPDKTDGTIIRDLLRWQSDYLRDVGRATDSLAVARRLIDVTEDTPTELSDAVGWLMERKYWTLVQEIADRHADDFARSPILMYRQAEALERQGDPQNAEKIAERAWKMHPDNGAAHLEVALDLRDRGLTAWAEREFRTTISIGPAGDPDEVTARYRLSELLFDYRRPLEAAKVWQQLVDLLEENQEVKNRFGERKQFFRSRMHYFYAEHYARENKRDEQIEQLNQAIRHDPTDADVLIAMYRVPNTDEAWKTRTSKLIADAARQFQQLNQQWSRIVEQQLDPDRREQIHSTLANVCNQYAWLVANTEGDQDEALRCGQRAVELMPQTSSYLDTLAHCYYAKRDYANAVRYQALAVQREPHSQQIRRQLDVFRKALEESTKDKNPTGGAP